ncbi:class I SAM-dependent methyltransferase [Cupriavidus respiraculi]|uniref:Methyltransferase type 11 domain-containing protein n=1 Tax=Cupriavidus respiraculi TaxID=195930 RepID=A0ABN7YG02_9BURK|nr:class I SAM-dependent methyltransferase [Cupriavidus respiraculi]CAG9172359.1 hypothetical protein LMG21510_01948 [Cupriavidus respiraculi]
MNKKIEAALPILRCPRTGTRLFHEGAELVSEAGERYPIVNGKPILVRNIQALHTTPPPVDIVSQNFTQFLPHMESRRIDGFKLHLGSGNVPCRDAHVLSVDILPTPNADLVAEAEALPFADNSLAWVESDAVFEHLYDPMAAIAEVRRILKPGGAMLIDTAFMQSYHGFPGHYLNMTPQAVETLLVDDFELLESRVPFKDRPSLNIEVSIQRLIDGLPLAHRHELLGMPVSRLLAALRDLNTARTWFDASSEYTNRSLGAGTMVIAAKPNDYEARRAAIIEKVGADQFARMKRHYYASRVAVQQRHHEAEFYRRRSFEVEPSRSDDHPLPDLSQCLYAAAVRDSLDPREWQSAIDRLSALDAQLTEIRDFWIRSYLPLAEASARIDAAFTDPIDTIHKLNADLDAMRELVQRLESGNAKLRRENQDAHRALEAMRTSTSWRITKPLRGIVTRLRIR